MRATSRYASGWDAEISSAAPLGTLILGHERLRDHGLEPLHLFGDAFAQLGHLQFFRQYSPCIGLYLKVTCRE